MTLKNQDNISIVDFIKQIKTYTSYLLSKWKLISIMVLIGMILGVLYSFLKPIKYRADITFVLEEKSKGGMGDYTGIASQFGINLGAGSSAGVFTDNNLIQFLQSRKLIEKTLLTNVKIDSNNILLIDLYIQNNKLRDEWDQNPAISNINFNVNRTEFTIKHDSLISMIYNTIVEENISIEKIDKKIDIILATYISEHQLFSKLFIEKLVENASDFYIDSKTLKSKKTVDIMQKRTDSVKTELNAALSGRAIVTDQNLFVVRQQANVSRVKQEVNVQVLSAMYTEMVKNLELAKFTRLQDEPVIQIIDEPILPLYKIRLSKSKGAIFGLVLSLLIVSSYLIIKKYIQDLNSNE